MKYNFFIALGAATLISCKSYTSRPIDSQPMVRIDSGLLGIWKIAEDTTQLNYFLVQDRHCADLSGQRIVWNYGSTTNFILSLHSNEDIDTQALQKQIEESDREDSIEGQMEQPYTYYISHIRDRGVSYRQWSTFLAKIKNSLFLNVSYLYTPVTEDGEALPELHESGYILFRILYLNNAHDTMITALVADTSLKTIKTSAEVRERISRNLNDSKFYSDTLHFYKIFNGHFELGQAVDKL